MKKVLFYLHFTKVGGAEKVCMQYMQGLIDKGYKVDLITDFDMGKEGNTFEYAIPREVSYKYIKSQKISDITYRLRTLGKKYKILNILLYIFMISTDFYYYHSRVKKIVKGCEYDWTISFYQFLPAYLTKIESSKHIIWLHGSVEHFFGGITKLFKRSFGKKLDKYDYIVAIADEMKEQLEKYYPDLSKEKIKRIYNPFDFEEIDKKSLDNRALNEKEQELLNNNYICTVTRLDEHQKDTTTLIKAYNELNKQNKISHKLFIIGDGPHKFQLESLVKEYSLEDKILFLGKKINPYIWMKNADAFVLSSKFEGLPTVLIEVMAVDTFIISANCKTGPKEILMNGECGDLFEMGNVDELAVKICNALTNIQYRYTKIQNAIEQLNRFDKANIIEELVNIIEK